MENLTLKEIVEAVSGETIKEGRTVKYEAVNTDTRIIKENSIFIALKGLNFNGNYYAVEASKKGAAVCIIDELTAEIEEFHKDVSVIKVTDCKKALLNLAKYYRSRLDVKVIGITGSTGKTSTKDLVAAFLSSKLKVFKTKGNFNNEIGLPLMIFNITNDYNVAVLEMGMSNLGEIQRLADVARPDIGIITNIGVSHIEYLKTRENILKAKLEITTFFNKNSTLIVNCDNDLLKTICSSTFNLVKVSAQEDECVDYKAVEIALNEKNIKFKVLHKNGEQSQEFNVKVPGKHNVSNSLLAIACGRELGISYEDMISGAQKLEVTSMRLDVIKGSRFTIIDDCYNASPDSMKAALDVLSDVEGNRRIAVLGTMKELGEAAWSLHKEIGDFASLKNIDLLIAIGEYSEAYCRGFNNECGFISLKDNNEAAEYLKKTIENKDVVLIKASRSMKFEVIVNELKHINS
jgi:UDP-N-acetylmuramoyl-tripeptide--D-alanyl-D-alanine ligase